MGKLATHGTDSNVKSNILDGGNTGSDTPSFVWDSENLFDAEDPLFDSSDDTNFKKLDLYEDINWDEYLGHNGFTQKPLNVDITDSKAEEIESSSKVDEKQTQHRIGEPN